MPWEDGRELSLGLDDAASAPGIADGAFPDPVSEPLPDPETGTEPREADIGSDGNDEDDDSADGEGQS